MPLAPSLRHLRLRGGHRFFGEYRLAPFEGSHGDRRLQLRRRRDRDGINIRMVDKFFPAPNASGMFEASANSAVRAASLPASAITSQRGSRRNAGRWTSRP
jgi:hypothetical protein